VSRAFFSGSLSEVLHASFTLLVITCHYWERWTHISSTASPHPDNEAFFPSLLGRLSQTRKNILDFRSLATVPFSPNHLMQNTKAIYRYNTL